MLCRWKIARNWLLLTKFINADPDHTVRIKHNCKISKSGKICERLSNLTVHSSENSEGIFVIKLTISNLSFLYYFTVWHLASGIAFMYITNTSLIASGVIFTVIMTLIFVSKFYVKFIWFIYFYIEKNISKKDWWRFPEPYRSCIFRSISYRIPPGLYRFRTYPCDNRICKNHHKPMKVVLFWW